MERRNMVEERRWEDLDRDCLVNVLERVGVQSLFSDVPFVCKSWHKASLDPSCWKYLVFPDDWSSFEERLSARDICQPMDFSISRFIKFIINRSCKNATTLYVPGGCSTESLNYAADESPGLRFLRITASQLYDHTLNLMEVLGKWKGLEDLVLDYCDKLVDNLTAISLNCKNLNSLRVINAKIDDREALAIVTLLPNIKHLYLRRAWILHRENLVTVLKGCNELVTLDVRGCYKLDGKTVIDEGILNLASRIHTFKF